MRTAGTSRIIPSITVRRTGFLSVGYLRELVVVSVVLMIVLSGLESLKPTEESASNSMEVVLPIYHVGFSGHPLRVWCHRWGRGPEEVPQDIERLDGSTPLEMLPFPQLPGAYFLARSPGPIVTTVMADASGRFLLARDNRVQVLLDQPFEGELFREVGVTHDGDLVYALLHENGMHQWQWNGQEYVQQELAIPGEHLRLQVSPHGRFVAITTNRREVVIWDIARAEEFRRFEPHKNQSTCIAWSPDDTRLATSGDKGQLRLWDVTTGQMLWQASADSICAMTITFAADGTMLATGGFDKQVSIWNAQDGSRHSQRSGHTAPVRALAFDPAGERLISAGFDGRLLAWNTADGQAAVQIWPTVQPKSH